MLAFGRLKEESWGMSDSLPMRGAGGYATYITNKPLRAFTQSLPYPSPRREFKLQ